MKINKLPPNVADMIAAGEVVERPASVVKELIENSIDADAHAITVEIRRGGMSYIRVTDDGFGMSAEDAPTAFLRHATSKIQDERGLEAISTLGFRGEALAAIASVARVELQTRERSANVGTVLSIEGGAVVVPPTPSGCPSGTTIIISDLFFNTPARLKFMKTDNAEGAAVSAMVVRCALSHPELSFRYIRDGSEVFHTTSGDIRNCAYAVLGRDFALGLLELPENGDSTMSIKGLITPPSLARGNRNAQYFFVNGRAVKSQLLTAALEQAYRNLLPNARFPGCVIYLTLRPNSVDVNVHPAKTEVKFLYERAVFDIVHYSTKAALSPNSELRTLPKPTHTASKSRPSEPETVPQTPQTPIFSPLPEHTEVVTQLFSRQEEFFAKPTDNPQFSTLDLQFSVIGEVYGGYIIAECPTELLFIDKHAAHERLLFDKLKSGTYEIMPQILVAPLIIELGIEEKSLVLENAGELERLGFELENFGSNAIAVRQLPTIIEIDDLSELISALAESIRNSGRAGALGKVDEILSTVACKAAVKLGKNSDRTELTPLVAAVVSGQITHCPHGRPIVFRLPKEQLEKAMKRK